MTPNPFAHNEERKLILDACCSNRQMWFQKSHPNAVYIDIRKEAKGFVSSRPNLDVNPDILMDFRDLKFPDKSFKLIAWDPPHLFKLGENSIMRKKFGMLDSITWESDLRRGFLELWRVLDDYGVLVFKWNIQHVSMEKVLRLFCAQPLFGHTTGSKSQTRWMTFMKIPGEEIKKRELI